MTPAPVRRLNLGEAATNSIRKTKSSGAVAGAGAVEVVELKAVEPSNRIGEMTPAVCYFVSLCLKSWGRFIDAAA